MIENIVLAMIVSELQCDVVSILVIYLPASPAHALGTRGGDSKREGFCLLRWKIIRKRPLLLKAWVTQGI